MVAQGSMDGREGIVGTAQSLPKFPTIRRKLTIVVLSCIMPATLGLCLLVFQFYENVRSQLERDALQTVRALTAAVDRDLSICANVALALATSHDLAVGDLSAFQAQATSLLRDGFLGSTFVLSDESGQQVVNTARRFGEPLPRQGNPDLLRQVFETGKPHISDIFLGSVQKRPLVSVDIPVWRDGKVRYDLSVGILPERLGKVLSEQRLPPGRIVAIFDTKGVIVARTHMADKFVGQKGAPAVIEKIQQATEGTVSTTTVEGISVYVTFNRSLTTGWTVALGIPKAELTTELLHSITLVPLIVLGLLLSGFWMAWILGGRIGRSVRALRAPAYALGSGQPVVVPPGYFQEEYEVAQVLKSVEGELSHFRQQ